MNQLKLRQLGLAAVVLLFAGVAHSQDTDNADSASQVAALEASNPLLPIPDPPLGIGTDENLPAKLTEFENPPTPIRLSFVVRCGRRDSP